MLGVALLEGLGQDYIEGYWRTMVTTTGATHVIPVHFDDYTQPFGEVQLMPRILDNFLDTAKGLEGQRAIWDSDTKLHMPEFGKTVVLYPDVAPEA